MRYLQITSNSNIHYIVFLVRVLVSTSELRWSETKMIRWYYCFKLLLWGKMLANTPSWISEIFPASSYKTLIPFVVWIKNFQELHLIYNFWFLKNNDWKMLRSSLHVHDNPGRDYCYKSEIKMLICSGLFLVNVEFLTLNISGNLKIVWQAILIRSLTITLCCFKICLFIYRQNGYKKTL